VLFSATWGCHRLYGVQWAVIERSSHSRIHQAGRIPQDHYSEAPASWRSLPEP